MYEWSFLVVISQMKLELVIINQKQTNLLLPRPESVSIHSIQSLGLGFNQAMQKKTQLIIIEKDYKKKGGKAK